MSDVVLNKIPPPVLPSTPAGTDVAPSKPDMVWIAGRHLPHGLGQALSGGSAGPSRHRRRLLDRSHAGDQRAVPPLRRRDRLRDLRRDRARPEGLSRRAAAHAQGRLAGVQPAEARGRPARLEPVVDVQVRRQLAAPLRSAQLDQRARRSSGRARRLSAMRRPMRAGPARICRPKPSGNSPRAAGSTVPSSPGATSSRPADAHMANTWQGDFPHENLATDGYERTSPVTAFPPNGYGLYDMIGNVWEWTSDWYSPKHEADAPKACCIPENPRGGREDDSYDPCQPQIRIPRKVLKGGSHLCAPNYCRRYRPAARHARAGRHLDQPRRLSLRRQEAARIERSRRNTMATVSGSLAPLGDGRLNNGSRKLRHRSGACRGSGGGGGQMRGGGRRR